MPPQEPLLLKLADKPPRQQQQMCQQALSSFAAILQYMGDAGRAVDQHCHSSTTQLTDQIIQPMINSGIMCDEVYCQLMKQLTRNPNQSVLPVPSLVTRLSVNSSSLTASLFCNPSPSTPIPYRLSVDRGWQLMWLATGMAVPSKLVFRELEAFLKSTNHAYGKACLQQLEAVKRLARFSLSTMVNVMIVGWKLIWLIRHTTVHSD